ncbi:hypothetical protein SOVF_013780, partial [Spinacia oleracea]
QRRSNAESRIESTAHRFANQVSNFFTYARYVRYHGFHLRRRPVVARCGE